MSTASFETGPLLVSDLPPVTVPVPGFVDLLRARFSAARDRRDFERAVRFAGPNEQADLLAQARRG
ncbi:MAG: hypothetical protein QOG99_223 [Frankiales bacterium]|jgi:hypothetical protein|nr:hypothetical protein [Frankiales bacterium]